MRCLERDEKMAEPAMMPGILIQETVNTMPSGAVYYVDAAAIKVSPFGRAWIWKGYRVYRNWGKSRVKIMNSRGSLIVWIPREFQYDRERVGQAGTYWDDELGVFDENRFMRIGKVITLPESRSF